MAECGICEGRGWVSAENNAVKRCSCFDPRASIWQRAEVPSRYRVPFEDLEAWPVDPRPGSVDLREWRGEPWSVVIRGAFGCGKTKLGVELLDRLVLGGEVSAWRFVKAETVPDLCFAGGEAWRDLCACPAMLLDDVGRGYKGDQAMAIARLVSHRYDWRLPTVFPTNLAEESAGMDDEAMLDRLTDGLSVRLEGESRRGRR